MDSIRFSEFLSEAPTGFKSTGRKDANNKTIYVNSQTGKYAVNIGGRGKDAEWKIMPKKAVKAAGLGNASPSKKSIEKEPSKTKSSSSKVSLPSSDADAKELVNSLLGMDDSQLKKVIGSLKGKYGFNPGATKIYFGDNPADPKTRTKAQFANSGKLINKLKDLGIVADSSSSDDAPKKSVRELGHAFKPDTGKLDDATKKQLNAFQGNPIDEVSNASKYLTGDNAKALQKVIDTMAELGHDEGVGIVVEEYFTRPDTYKKNMNILASNIVSKSADTFINTFSSDKEAVAGGKKIKSILKKMDSEFKSGKMNYDNLSSYYAQMENALPSQYRGAFGNNMAEMYAVQVEVMQGDYVTIPTAGNAKLGDKTRIMSRGEKTSDKPIVIVEAQGSVKKEDKSTVGGQHSFVGVLEGCDYKDEKTKANVISSSMGTKYLFPDEDLAVARGEDPNQLKTDKKNMKVYLLSPSPSPKILKMAGITDFIKDDKKSMNNAIEKLKEFCDDPNNRVKIKNELVNDVGFNSDEMKKERKIMARHIKKHGSDKIAEMFVGSSSGKAGKMAVNVLNTIAGDGNVESLTPKEMQMFAMLTSVSQKKGENFTYDVVATGSDKWNLKKGYGQDDNNETIHSVGGSYMLGMMLSYNFNPRIDSGKKIFNIGKRSITAIKAKSDKAKSLGF